MVTIARTDTPDALRSAVTSAVAVLRANGLVAFPTETVYGLGADAGSPAAVARIFAAKGRPANHPLIVHIAHAEHLSAWARDVPDAARALANAFWPGPMTLILQRAPHVCDEVTGGQHTIGLRVPGHPVALALLQAFGGGIAAPSANRFGHVSPTTAAHVVAELGDAVDFVLDGGPCTVGIESTIVDLSGARPRVLRPGGISRARIAAVLGDHALLDDSAALVDAPRVSGALASHYAPRARVRWVETEGLAPTLRAERLHEAASHVHRAALIALDTNPSGTTAHRVVCRVLPANPERYARELYACLRELDALEPELIVLEVPPDTADWEAVRDRLRKAAGLGERGVGGA